MNKIFFGATTLFALAAAHLPLAASAIDSSPPNIDAAADSTHVPADAQQVVAFWQDAGPALWFAKDPQFDRRFRERFFALHEAAARGELAQWSSSPEGTLALIILLDQFPRNAFRGSPHMYATDVAARALADAAVASGQDRAVPQPLRLFIYLPFGHSEDLADQERSVALARTNLSASDLEHAEHHRDIIKRFGRFPHRNAILGRVSTTAERAYLDNGGYKG